MQWVMPGHPSWQKRCPIKGGTYPVPHTEFHITSELNGSQTGLLKSGACTQVVPAVGIEQCSLNTVAQWALH